MLQIVPSGYKEENKKLCWQKWKLFHTIYWSSNKGHLLYKKTVNSRLTRFKNPMAAVVAQGGLEYQKRNILLADTERQEKAKRGMAMRCVGLQFVDSGAYTQSDVMFGTHLHLDKRDGDPMRQRRSEATWGVSSCPGLSCEKQHKDRTWAHVVLSVPRSSSIF